jgi:transcriptional regulator with XRE-family HTH domain
MAGFTYKSYNFTDKDPIIDEVRTLYEEAGVNYKWISDESGVSQGTLTNWFSGTTKRPQAATINAVLRALGYKLGVVPHSVPVQFRPALKQPKQSVRHVVQMTKYRRAKRG